MKAYFPKLDSIRFFAFLLVFISHIYIFCYHVGPTTSFWFLDKGPKIFAHGEVGVHVFFTLSGFLIMLLAIREFKAKSSFSILGFFKRRILRIWPVYFLALAVGVLIAGGLSTDPTCVHRFWYFLGNTCMATGVRQSDLIALIGPLWSVSVEEQFYLAFPLLFASFIFLFRKWGKKVAYICGCIAGLVLIESFVRRYAHSDNWDYISYSTMSVLPSLFLGMILALVSSVERWGQSMAGWVRKNNLFLKLLAVLFFLTALYVKFEGAIGITLYIVILFLCTTSLILLGLYTPLEVNPSRLQKASRYLGRISYGLYAYHMFAIVGVKHIFHAFGMNNGTLPVMYAQAVLIFGVTIVAAHLSYRYIEKAFLRLK